MDKLERLMRMNGVKSLKKPEPEPVQNSIVNITREEFNLLDATKENTIYYIAEENGNVTVLKGDNA